jgi:hypothetical protein
MSIYLQKSASTEPRTSPPKFQVPLPTRQFSNIPQSHRKARLGDQTSPKTDQSLSATLNSGGDSESSRQEIGGRASSAPCGTPVGSSEDIAISFFDNTEMRVLKIELSDEIQTMVQGESYVTVSVPLTASLFDLLAVVQRKLQREFSAVDFGFESTDPNSQRLCYDRYMLVKDLKATKLRLARTATTGPFFTAPTQNPGIRPDASIFHFTTSSAVELTEYLVRVDIPGEAPGRPASLVVCYPRLLHRWIVSPEPSSARPVERRTRSWTRMLGLDHTPPWQQDGRALLDELEELNVDDDLESAECDEESLAFLVSYRLTERNKTRPLAIKYHAETPTECALIVAHLQYLIKWGGE